MGGDGVFDAVGYPVGKKRVGYRQEGEGDEEVEEAGDGEL